MDLSSFFNPRSIAIVGVSYDPKKVGHLVAKNLLKQGYKDDIYFINKDADKPILGKKVYADIREVKKQIDLVVLAIPADIALGYLDTIHELGIKNVVLFAAGFKEIGDEGVSREKLLLEKCEKYDITLLGPNCIGYTNTQLGVNTTFLKDISPKGNIAFISQSGALGSIINDFFTGHANVGFSYFVSLGNKSVLDESDVLQYMADDPATEVIGLYLEDVKDGQRFMKVLREAASKKPIIILKSGMTAEGSQAALSHTGGLVGDDEVYTTAIRQCGAIRASTFREFTMLLILASFKRLPRNNNVLVLSNAGGAGVLLTDQIIEHGLKLVTISEATKRKVAKAFGDHHKVTVRNPIDLLGDASSFDYKQGIEMTMHERNIGSVIVLLSPQANTEIMETAKVIVELQKQFKEPIYPVFMGAKSIEGATAFFEKHKMAGFASFDLLPLALSKLEKLGDYAFNREKDVMDKLTMLAEKKDTVVPPGKKIKKIGDITDFLKENGKKKFLSLSDSLKLLEMAGAPVILSETVQSEIDLKKIAEKIGYPLVAKLNSPEITHKTEVRGVVTDIGSWNELTPVYKRFKTYKGASCTLQPMVKGVELFVGGKRDPHFGPVVVVGIGGVFTELVKEVVYGVNPLFFHDFNKLLSEGKIGKLLTGFRGNPPVNNEELFDTAKLVLDLLNNEKRIKEIDLNPIIGTSKGLRIVDARILIETS